MERMRMKYVSKEQVEEESISRTILDMAREQATWLRKENAILDFYNGLGRK